MTEEIKSLEDLKRIVVTQEPVQREPRVDSSGRSYATGKRKCAVARVWVWHGSGQMTVNGHRLKDYFTRSSLQMRVKQPFLLVNRHQEFDVLCTVNGGGLSGQAGAIRHGISRALTYCEPDLRPVLKASHCLTRDARVVERKKYGKAKARRSFQFSKR